SKPVKLDAPAKVDEKDRAKDLRAGEVLFRSTGCLACHRVGEQGKFDPYGGGDLSAVGQKRSVEWLTTWLANPAKLNPDHRMPVFALEAKQRSQVVRYLASLQGEKPREAAGQGQAPKA